MKKVLFILFAAICLSSCGANEFTIDGVVADKGLDGQTIFIKERINREWVVLDSAVVENGKFTFNGVADSAKIAYLAYVYPSDKKVRQAFVLENGKLTVAIDTAGFMVIKGTSQNDLLQTYQDAKNVFDKKLDAFYQANNDTAKTPAQQAAFSRNEKELEAEGVEIDKKFAAGHVNTIAGTHVFINSFYAMSIEEKEAIINLMNEDTKNVKRIQEIIADIETEKKVSVGQQYAEIKLPSVAGDTLALSALVGRTDYVLIDFWASWCGPCMAFLPELKAFYAKHKGSKLEILGVSLDDDKQAWVNTIASKKMTWKQVSDLKGWKCEGSRIYAVNSIPATVLIDKNGKIVGRNLSVSEMDNLLTDKAIEK